MYIDFTWTVSKTLVLVDDFSGVVLHCRSILLYLKGIIRVGLLVKQPFKSCLISTIAEVRLSSTMTLRERTPDVWRQRRVFHRGIGDALLPRTLLWIFECKQLTSLSVYPCILVSWHLEWYPVGHQDAYTMQKKALGEGSFGSAFRATCKSSWPVAMMFPLVYLSQSTIQRGKLHLFLWNVFLRGFQQIETCFDQSDCLLVEERLSASLEALTL